MKTKRILFFIIAILLVTGFAYLIINNFGRGQLASLEVNSNTTLPVYVDGKQVGQTPYTGIFSPKEVTLKIGNYETQIDLQPQIKTVVTRNFDKDMQTSSGEILSFQKNDLSYPTLAVISNPDSVNVNVDGVQKGITPVNINETNAGIHKLDLEDNGYISVDLSLHLVNGYKLTAVIDLTPVETQKQVTPTDNLKIAMVQILATPNGFLRVREEPTTTSTEIGQVHTGETYQLIKTDKQTGWYDIQLTASASGKLAQSGWITNVYAGLK